MPQLQSRALGYGLRAYAVRSCAPIVRRKHRGYATFETKPASTASSDQPEIYDVVCVGGGPAGLSVLAALSTLI